MRIFFFFLLTATATGLWGQTLYHTDQIVTIEITFPEDDWHQTLNDLHAAGNGGRLIGMVEINGELFDSVGIRYRGGRTYDPANAKNPLNIKLDFLKNQDYEGYEVLKLSNGAKDPSWLREVLGYEIARYAMVAPLANYASVFVNGNFLGLYANVESINSKFFTDRFHSSPDNPRLEADPSYRFDEMPPPPASGCTQGHGSALEYLGPSTACYQPHYELKSPTGWDELIQLTELIQNNPADLCSLLDLDRFVWMSAFNNLTVNLDSHLGASPRNYFIFKTDNGHWVPVVEDLNETFARFPWLSVPAAGDPQPPLDFYTQLDLFEGENNDQKPLLKALLSTQTGKNQYVAHLRTLINHLFASGWFEQRAQQLQALINDEVLSDDNHFYTHSDFLNNFNQTVIDSYDGEDAYGLFPLMEGRIAYLLSQPALQATPPAIANIESSPAMPPPNTGVLITATISNATEALLGYRTNLHQVFVQTPMFDDGNHGDGSANDGVFGVTLTVPAGGIQYYIYAENDSAGTFAPERAEFVFYQISTSGAVVINEILASNQNTVADQDGEFDDWAELYNNSSSPVDLAGWYLSDDPQNPGKYQLPDGVVLNPGSYLIIWCDDDELQAGLHASFNLNADGETLLLSMPDLTPADQVVFGAQTTDVSFGRCPNGSGTFAFMPPSFGADNISSCAIPVTTVTDIGPLQIYPNPATNQLTVETNRQQLQQGALWSARGRRIRSFSITGKTTLDLSGLPPGLYFLSVNGAMAKKVVVR